MYNHLFDANCIYQATKGSVTYPVYDLEKRTNTYSLNRECKAVRFLQDLLYVFKERFSDVCF